MNGPIRRLRAFRRRWRQTHDAVGDLRTDVDDLRRDLPGATDRAAEAADAATASRARVEAFDQRLQVLEVQRREIVARLDDAEARRRQAELHARVPPTMAWIEQVEVPANTLVSVILPTRNRPELVRHAIDSVLEQRYSRWELLLVDDGEVPGQSVPAGTVPEDERIRTLLGPRRGVSAARNLALEQARGELITYLDDDNLMHPLWLKSVVWAFDRRPDAPVLYGARIVEDAREIGERQVPFPAMALDPFSRRRLEEGNYIDLGAIAHRAGLPEARFDEELEALVDWDLILRLTRTRAPIVLPMVASLYLTSAPNRASRTPRSIVDFHTIRSRLQSTRTLRVLAYNAMFPQMSETYVQDELEALAQNGADVAYAREAVPPSEMVVDRSVHMGLEPALRDHRPDLLFLHWLTWADQRLEAIEATGVPFAVRVHSFDFDPQVADRIAASPSCIGIWAYPHHAAQIPHARTLPPLFTSVDRLPAPAETRDTVLSASAGLPKKDWELLLDAFSRVEGATAEIIVATTIERERLVGEVAAMAQRYANPPTVRIDVPREEVFRRLARTAVLVYTLEPGGPFGNPMSVVEALCMGTSVVLPDRPEARRFAGPAARFYATADDIVGHVKDVLGGGPEIEDERAANRSFGLRSFADPALGRRFFSEVVESLDAWRAART